MPIVGVMGSGTREWEQLAEPLGRWLAENGYDLADGGRSGHDAFGEQGVHECPEAQRAGDWYRAND